MRSTLDELSKDLSELRALVSSIRPVNEVLSAQENSLVREFLNIRRRFDYAAFIVALYASFEKYAENLVVAFARLETLRKAYGELPAILTRKHLHRSAAILQRERLGEGRYVGVSEYDVVSNLFRCISGASPYALNDPAVAAHDMNLRFEELCKLFNSVGLGSAGEMARRTDEMALWFQASQGLPEGTAGDVPAATVRQRLDDLVERRNQVTHRGGSPEDLLGPTEMKEQVDFVEALAKGLYSVAVSSYLQSRYVESKEGRRLRLREGPLMRGTVVVVVRPKMRLFVGQPAFVLTKKAGVRWGRIRSIQIDGKDTNVVEADAKAPTVGLQMGFRCPKSPKIFVLSSEDEAVWGPAT